MTNSNTNSVVIVEAKRTAMGGFMGGLSPIPATTLGGIAVKAITGNIEKSQIEEVIMGCVLPAGLGQAPARQASLYAQVPMSAGALTINKVCGSGMKAIMLASDLIKAKTASTIIAGGMESMSNAPYLLPKARKGYRMGHGQTLDHMMLDGLENAYDGQAMGCFAQATADKEHMTRQHMDDFAIESLSRAKHATESGFFNEEIVPVSVQSRKQEIVFDIDEGPLQAKLDKIPHLRPAFAKNGTVTAANSSSISDGAAALLIMSEAAAIQNGLTPMARIVAHATHAMKPEEFTVAPVGAIEKVLQKSNWQVEDVDLFEINEAFAMVTMLAMNKLKLDHAKVNVHGGACALGHPIGASGARIVVTLLHALKQHNKQKGLASLCIGGGEATAITVEILN